MAIGGEVDRLQHVAWILEAAQFLAAGNVPEANISCDRGQRLAVRRKGNGHGVILVPQPLGAKPGEREAREWIAEAIPGCRNVAGPH